MWEYLAVLLLGFWLGVAIFLYVSCYWLEEIFDLPPAQTDHASSSAHSGASSAHAQLKRLVARVVEEAAALPALARYAAEPTRSSPIDSSTYEDILATAILNKVIERYQTENGSGGRSSGIHSASASPTPSERSSPRSLHSRHSRHRDITPPLQEEDDVSDWEEGEAADETLELPRRVPFPEFGGDIIHHMENIERDFDEVSSSDIQAIDGSWEENWLFQKKKIKTIQSVPVPMLVPNSNTDYRALIGDRDADDTTDLSDNASDGDEEVGEYKSDIKRVLDSKHIIGGKTVVDEYDFEPDSLTIIDGVDEFEEEDEKNHKQGLDIVDAVNNDVNENTTLNLLDNDLKNENVNNVLILSVNSGPVLKAEFALKEEIHRTNFNGHLADEKEGINEKVNGELYSEIMDSIVNNNKGSTNTLQSRHEREGEYEETVTLPVQRYADSLRRKHFDDLPQEIPTRDTDKDEELIPGSVAYRERKKWLNCVEMPNNPYSPEAIQKRLSAKSTSSLFDIITSNSKDLNEDPESLILEDIKEKEIKLEHIPVKEEKMNKVQTLTVHTEKMLIRSRSNSPQPKALQDVLSEEVPQYKRYGRDYYIRESRSSSGGRTRSAWSDTASVSSCGSEGGDGAGPRVSALRALEAAALRHNVVRAVLSPTHASPNFAINPIFENPDRLNETDTSDIPRRADVRDSRPVCDDDDCFVETEDIVRLKIPTKPEITEDLFETYNHELIHQFNTIAANQSYTKFSSDESQPSTLPSTKNEILIEYGDIDKCALFVAKPAVTDNDINITIDEQSLSSEDTPKSPNTSNDSIISTNSLEDTIKIYNIQTGEIVKIKPEDNVSVRYDASTPDTNDNIDIPDNNISEDIDKFNHTGSVETSLVIVEHRDEKLDVISEIEEILPQLPKVKELAKIFVSMEHIEEPVKQPAAELTRKKSKDNLLNPERNKLQYMHSLTARSISKEFRDELKLSLGKPLTIPGGAKEIAEGEEVIKESSRPGSPLPEPGSIKRKLAFFESLKSKLITK